MSIENKTRPVPNEAYYYNQIIDKMDEIIREQKNIESVLRSLSLSTMNQPKPKVKETDISYEGFMAKAEELSNFIVSNSNKYKTPRSVYTEIFNEMTSEYGICWSQQGKEVKNTYGLTRAPSRMETCYNDFMSRSIFMSKLEDKANKIKEANKKKEESKPFTLGEIISKESRKEMEKVTSAEGKTVQEIIQPLLDKNKDASRHHSHTYEMIYKEMGMTSERWEIEKENYRKNSGSNQRVIPKNKVIMANENLRREFIKAVNKLIAA